MKKHLLSLIAVAFLAIGITACSNAKSSDDSKGEKTENKDDLKDPDSVGTTFVDLLNDCTAKINNCTNEQELDEVGNQFEQACEEFKNDEANLSDSERTEITNSLSDFTIAMGLKTIEYEGETLTPEMADMFKTEMRKTVESACGHSRNIKEIIANFNNLSE